MGSAVEQLTEVNLSSNLEGRQEAVGRNKGFTYSRSANPTVSALERRLAALVRSQKPGFGRDIDNASRVDDSRGCSS
jgi:cystathionine beta-lyase/cystathionine gamma-synthase